MTMLTMTLTPQVQFIAAAMLIWAGGGVIWFLSAEQATPALQRDDAIIRSVLWPWMVLGLVFVLAAVYWQATLCALLTVALIVGASFAIG